MPVYNASQYLAEAIDSIIAQTLEDWELIIIDDGSTDTSDEIIRSYTDTRIRYFQNDGNKGLIYTRNKLIELATGEYIAFLDSDDISMPERLQQQVAFLDNNPDYGLCGTWSLMIDVNGSRIKKINMPVSDEEIRCSLLFINTFVQSSIMIRKKILLDHPYNGDYPLAEDYELWCRLSRQYKLKNLPAHHTRYRWHNTNISKSKKEQLDNLVKNIYRRELSYIGIDASDKELTLHSAIRDKTISNLPSKQLLQQIGEWLKRLSEAAIQSNKYDNTTLLATVAFRWIFACKGQKHYLKALSLPVKLNIKGYRLLLKMLRERL